MLALAARRDNGPNGHLRMPPVVVQQSVTPRVKGQLYRPMELPGNTFATLTGLPLEQLRITECPADVAQASAELKDAWCCWMRPQEEFYTTARITDAIPTLNKALAKFPVWKIGRKVAARFRLCPVYTGFISYDTAMILEPGDILSTKFVDAMDAGNKAATDAAGLIHAAEEAHAPANQIFKVKKLYDTNTRSLSLMKPPACEISIVDLIPAMGDKGEHLIRADMVNAADPVNWWSPTACHTCEQQSIQQTTPARFSMWCYMMDNWLYHHGLQQKVMLHHHESWR